ncbi:MAG: helix-turn-helix transcriptional regulator [Roseovarius sp.]|jgi:TetR/AcrR family transcriptional repressor of nem operon|nr:helix-turn-helix transcriptional regulator [Roseovarius sp.]
MDAAERRIRGAGYNGFSFREIAHEIGVKSASVHYHFPTKQALAAAVARRYTDRVLRAVDMDVARGDSAMDAWIAAFRRALSNDGRMCLCGALGAASRDLPQEVMIEARRFFELSLSRLTQSGLSEVRAMQVIGALEGGMLLATALENPEAFEAVAAGLVEQR